MDDFLEQDELLIGLALLQQLFEAVPDAQVALDVEKLYHGQEKKLFKTMIAASSLCLQKYAAASGLPESTIIAAVRNDLLTGKPKLA